MRLTEPLRPDPANADSDTYGLAAPAQVSFPSSDLAELRFDAPAEKENLAYLTQMAEHGTCERLRSPGIGAVDVLADLPGKGIEVVHEHSVIRDLELLPSTGREDDAVIATGKKLEGRQEDGLGRGGPRAMWSRCLGQGTRWSGGKRSRGGKGWAACFRRRRVLMSCW
jgi:hypothetical protein